MSFDKLKRCKIFPVKQATNYLEYVRSVILHDDNQHPQSRKKHPIFTANPIKNILILLVFLVKLEQKF